MKRKLEYFVFFFFFLSGFSALTFQVAWQKILSQTVGTDHHSITLIVAIFMLGLGAGGYVGGLLTDRFQRTIFLFFVFEFCIAMFAFVSPELLHLIAIWSRSLPFSNFGATGLATDFVVNFAVLLIPTFLMGASLPLVVHSFRELGPGSATGYLYGTNIAGAAIGCLVAGVFLIGEIGLSATIRSAATVTFIFACSGLTFWHLLRRSGSVSAPTEKTKTRIETSLATTPVRAVAFIVGFVALSYEIVYFKIAIFYFSASAYVFPIILFCYLVLMAMGTWAAGKILAWRKEPQKLAVALCVIAAIATPLVFYGPIFFDVSLENSQLVFRTSIEFLDLFQAIPLALVGMVPITFISMFFPILVQFNAKGSRHLGRSVGEIYLYQTAGNFLGAIVTGLLFIPTLGPITTMKLNVLLIIVTGILILISGSRDTEPTLSWRGAAALAVAALSVVAFSERQFLPNFTYYGKTPRPAQTPYGTALIYDYPDNGGARIQIGAEPATSYRGTNVPIPLWPMDVALTMLGRKPDRFLVIGLGTADQAQTVHALFPEAELVIVELLNVVISESRERGAADLRQTLEDAEVIVTDGRRYINKLDGTKKFDLIQVGVFRSTSAGAGNLFTREFLAELQNHLSPGGVLTFNAYPPSVKVGMDLFETTIIAARSEIAMGDVFFRNGAMTQPENFPKRYAVAHNAIAHRIELSEKLRKKVSPATPSEAFLVFNRDAIVERLRDIDLQIDDLPASEYRLTNRISFLDASGHPLDPAGWYKTPEDVSVAPLLAAE